MRVGRFGRNLIRVAVLALTGAMSATAALVPPFFLDCVVAIGRYDVQFDSGARPAPKWVTEASGFFYGEFVNKVDEKTSNYHVFLVTNGHVIQNHQEIIIRVNPRAAGRAKEYPIPLNDPQGKRVWYTHPDLQLI